MMPCCASSAIIPDTRSPRGRYINGMTSYIFRTQGLYGQDQVV